MRIWVKPDQLASLGLTVPDLVDAIQKQNAVNPSGKIGGEPAPPGQELTWSVRAQGRLVTAEEFGDVVVRSSPTGAQVRLKDVARIELGALNYNQRGRLNGQARRDHRRLPDPGLERARGRGGAEERDGGG